MKNLLLLTIAGCFMLAGACIAAGVLKHIAADECLILTVVSFLLAGFGAIEYNTCEDY